MCILFLVPFNTNQSINAQCQCVLTCILIIVMVILNWCRKTYQSSKQVANWPRQSEQSSNTHRWWWLMSASTQCPVEIFSVPKSHASGQHCLIFFSKQRLLGRLVILNITNNEHLNGGICRSIRPGLAKWLFGVAFWCSSRWKWCTCYAYIALVVSYTRVGSI